MKEKHNTIFERLSPEKQEKIVREAIEEFSTYGFHRASINRLVKRLGIAKGSIFQYFGTKEGLFSFIFDYSVELVKATLKKVRENTKGLPFFERLKEILKTGIDFVENHPKIYRIYLKMIFQDGFPLREAFLKKVHLFSADYLVSIIEDSIRKGEIRNDLDVKTITFFLDAIMDRFLQAYTTEFLDANTGIYKASREELERFIDQLVNIIEKGLSSKG